MPPDGLLVIDKPAGLTSHDVVQRVRRAFEMKRVGHGGTLDPDATGVLLVALGQATRFFPFLSKAGKSYEGRIRLGFSTDTYDGSGRPASEDSPERPDRDAVAAAMARLEGRILQAPPPFSAKKVGGKPAYKRARAKEEFSLKPSEVTVRAFRLISYEHPFVAFEAECSAGTYVRSLAHDLGRDLGCGAHLVALRRTAVGPYHLADAVTLEKLESSAPEVSAADFLVPLEDLLPEVPAVQVGPEAAARVLNGSPLAPSPLTPGPPARLPFPAEAPVVRLIGPTGRLLALARPSPDGAALLPFLVLS